MSLFRRGVLAGARAVLGPRGRAFARALEDPEAAQALVRRDVARALARTDYGRSLGVTGEGDFAERVPVATWEDLAPWVERQRREEGPIIAAERVLFYEKTSGSSGPAKYIPYTAALRRTFSRMFVAWAHDVLARGPRLDSARLYFSVSPSFSDERRTERGVAVGTEDDRDYLEGWLRPLLAPFVVAPRHLGRERDPAVFLRRLALALLAAEDLEIISVWSPSFLLAVLEYVARERRALAEALPAARARALLAAADDWSGVWPRLTLISCWDQGASAPFVERLRVAFPDVFIQGKGLLATEAPVTIPWMGAAAPVPLVDDVLIELERPSGRLVPLWGAEEGQEYRVVVSPRGGLPRYALGDRVVARGRVGRTPGLAFLGRGGGVSDLVGEKLSEGYVAGILPRLHLPVTTGAVLIPVRAPRERYVLLVDAPRVDAGTAEALEAALGEAHHYRHARLLGQLERASVLARPGATQWVVDQQLRRGLKWGDIKPTVLLTTSADDLLTRLIVAAERR